MIIKSAEEEIQDLKNLASQFREKIDSLQKEIDSLQKEIDMLDGRIKNLQSKSRAQSISDSTPNYDKKLSVTSYSAQKNIAPFQPPKYDFTQNDFSKKSTVPISSPKKIPDDYPRHDSIKNNAPQTVNSIRPKLQSNSIDKKSEPVSINLSSVLYEFNAFANVQDRFKLKNLRDDFVQKYAVRSFSCVNFEARMNEPVPPPQFEETENILSGEYWAIHFRGNVFIVFPNVKKYTNNHHITRAMGEIFESNFQSGKTYTKIFVEQPAFFECAGSVWTRKVKGKLRLDI